MKLSSGPREERNRIVLLLAVAAAVMLSEAVPAVPSAPGSEIDRTTKQRILDGYGRLPLVFEANRGQTDPNVDFVARSAGYVAYLTGEGAVMAWAGPDQESGEEGSREVRAVRLELLGAEAEPEATGLRPLATEVHYFTSRRRTTATTFAEVRYAGVYPGIDLVYRGRGRRLEYDFVVAPGADYRAIRMRFEGADRVRLDRGGDLVLEVGDAEIVHEAPLIYQEVDGSRRQIAGRYRLRGRDVSLQVAKFDASRPLVIDPPVQFAYGTYLGGSSTDLSNGIAVDGAGSAYVVGETLSLDFPTANPIQAVKSSNFDAFVTKLNADGTALVYSTYLGGLGPDRAEAVTVDADGHAYVVGSTGGAGFPIEKAYQPDFGGGGFDAFVTKLGPAGDELVFSTFLGGRSTDGAFGVALDGGGRTYVAGETRSPDFPTSGAAFQQLYGGGFRDAFVTKFQPSGRALAYSTYLGGTSEDRGFGIAVDGFGCAYATGGTRSLDFPTTAGSFQPAFGGGLGDAWVTKLNPLGSALEYSTYLGGSNTDVNPGSIIPNGIAVDALGLAHVTGDTRSLDFPTTAGSLQPTFGGASDGFVTKLSASGGSLMYSTYLGGADTDRGAAIALDAAGNAYVVGDTNSKDFPKSGGPISADGGAFEAFITKIDPQGVSYVYSFPFGGKQNDGGDGVAVDALGQAYVTGFTQSDNFRTTRNAFQRFRAGGNDTFVVKLTAGD